MVERHVFQRATVSRIIKETADSRTYVLVPDEQPFSYRAGQFCTFQVTVDGQELCRSYSMSSAPETDAEVMTTVKRVTGGRVSNWIIDNVVECDQLTMTMAAGPLRLPRLRTRRIHGRRPLCLAGHGERSGRGFRRIAAGQATGTAGVRSRRRRRLGRHRHHPAGP